MKIAIVTNIPTPYRKGFFKELAGCIGVELTVYYCSNGEPDRRWGEQIGDGYKSVVLPGFSLGGYLHTNPEIFKVLRKERPDIVVVGGYVYPTGIIAILGAKLLKLPVVLWLDGVVGTSKLKLLKYCLLKQMSGYICTSKKVIDSIKNLRLPVDKAYINPLSIDIGTWRNLSSAKINNPVISDLLQRFPQSKLVIYCGRFIKIKNIDTIIELASRMQCDRNIKFVLIGDGPLLPSYKYKVNQLKLDNVLFVGHLPPEELPPIFRTSSLLLLLSTYEQWGAVVNEALSVGTPVVCSGVAGAAEVIVHGHNSFIVEPDDINSIEKIVKDFLYDDARITKMRTEAYETGSLLDHKNTADTFLCALHKILA